MMDSNGENENKQNNNKLDAVEGSWFLHPGAGEEQKASEARAWLEMMVQRAPPNGSGPDNGGYFDGLTLYRLQILHTRAGRAFCSFTVPRPLADEDGNWRVGAIASVIDYVGAAAIISAVGVLKASVDFDISYFSPAKVEEEVEIEAWVVHNVGKLSAVVVEIRKKGSGERVAFGRQWMTSIWLGNRGKL